MKKMIRNKSMLWIVALLVMVSGSVAWACKQICVGCVPCTTAGALRSGGPGCTTEKTYWNQTSSSDSCYDLWPGTDESEPVSGKTECSTHSQAQLGTITVKRCSQVYSFCICVTTDPAKADTWTCEVAALSGDDCTNK